MLLDSDGLRSGGGGAGAGGGFDNPQPLEDPFEGLPCRVQGGQAPSQIRYTLPEPLQPAPRRGAPAVARLLPVAGLPSGLDISDEFSVASLVAAFLGIEDGAALLAAALTAGRPAGGRAGGVGEDIAGRGVVAGGGPQGTLGGPFVTHGRLERLAGLALARRARGRGCALPARGAALELAHGRLGVPQLVAGLVALGANLRFEPLEVRARDSGRRRFRRRLRPVVRRVGRALPQLQFRERREDLLPPSAPPMRAGQLHPLAPRLVRWRPGLDLGLEVRRPVLPLRRCPGRPGPAPRFACIGGSGTTARAFILASSTGTPTSIWTSTTARYSSRAWPRAIRFGTWTRSRLRSYFAAQVDSFLASFFLPQALPGLRVHATDGHVYVRMRGVGVLDEECLARVHADRLERRFPPPGASRRGRSAARPETTTATDG